MYILVYTLYLWFLSSVMSPQSSYGHWPPLTYHMFKRTYHTNTYYIADRYPWYKPSCSQATHISLLSIIQTACLSKDMVKINVQEKISQRIGRVWEESTSPPDVMRQWCFRMVCCLQIPKTAAKTELPLSMTGMYRRILLQSTCNIICRW